MTNNIEAPKGPRDLFIKGGNRSGEGEISPDIGEKVLPLGAFSDFVLSEQPRLLSEIRDGKLGVDAVVQKQRALICELTQEDVTKAAADSNLARVAMLDLSFAMSGVTFSGGTPSVEVQDLNSSLAQITGLPETMTFEKIVSINSGLPFDQMRTFTDGEIGETEKRFYYGHDLMDVKMQNTTAAVTQAVEILRVGHQGVGESIELLNRGAGNMREFAEFMRGFMRMPREHFGVFRQYLTTYPDKTRNASGAFIGMPRLNIRLVGLSPRYEEFLEEGMKYFPIDEQSDIVHAREMAQRGDYLVAQCEKLSGEPRQQLARAIIRVIEPIRDFRLAHLAAVMHYVPKAVPEGIKDLKQQLAETEEEPILDDNSDVVKGTAGFLVGPLLRNTLRLDLRALERLKALSQKDKE